MRRSRRGLAVGEERIKIFVDRDENGPAEVGEILIDFQIVNHLFDHKKAQSAATIPTKVAPNAAWHGEQNCNFKSGRYPTCGCTKWKTAVSVEPLLLIEDGGEALFPVLGRAHARPRRDLRILPIFGCYARFWCYSTVEVRIRRKMRLCTTR